MVGDATLCVMVGVTEGTGLMERARFWVAFEICRVGEDVRLITCRQSLALVQMPQGRPLRLPADWADKYGHLGRQAP